MAEDETPVASTVEEAGKAEDEQPEPPGEAAYADEEARIARPTVRVHVNGNGDLSDPEKLDNGYIAIDPAEIVVYENGHSAAKPAEVDFDAAQDSATEAGAKATQNGNGHVDYGVDIRIDIRLDASRAMKIKRWEVKEEPFEGFNSPPGRF